MQAGRIIPLFAVRFRPELPGILLLLIFISVLASHDEISRVMAHIFLPGLPVRFFQRAPSSSRFFVVQIQNLPNILMKCTQFVFFCSIKFIYKYYSFSWNANRYASSISDNKRRIFWPWCFCPHDNPECSSPQSLLVHIIAIFLIKKGAALRGDDIEFARGLELQVAASLPRTGEDNTAAKVFGEWIPFGQDFLGHPWTVSELSNRPRIL